LVLVSQRAVVLEQNAARWHWSCYLKYNQTELSRAKKCKAESELSDVRGTKPNTSRRYAYDAKLYACYFCEEPGSPGTLCKIATFELDIKCALVMLICRQNWHAVT